METPEYKNIFDNEESHFLYISRHNLVISLLQKYTKGKQKLKILDAGCGTGGLAKKLKEFGDVWGIDIHPDALRFSKRRGVKVKKASVANIPFPASSFDVVVSVDVIYHRKVTNDKKALDEFFRVLKPGGMLIIRVPANKWLRLIHDQHVHTRKRYEKKELLKKLESAGFLIERISFVNAPLLPIAVLQSTWQKLAGVRKIESGIEKAPKILNQLLTLLLNFEVRLILWVNLSFGMGLIAVCKKPLRQR